MKRKVKIVTLSASNNYGAVLQNYALTKKLRDIGFEVETVKLRDTRVSKLLYIIHPFATLQKIIGLGVSIRRIFSVGPSNNIVPDPKIFNEFREKYVGITDESYNYEKLEKINHKPYAYIVGSDAVWSSDAVFKPPIHLLKFESDETVKKISYAASFGKGALEKYQHKEFRVQLKKFSGIGVREESGKQIIKKLDQDLRPVRVLDPTFLIDDYSEILSEKLVPRCKYILLYRLNQDNNLARASIKFVEKFAKMNGLQIVNVSPESNRTLDAAHVSLAPSPGEFLELIKNAEYCFTNSFHGVVFSLKFQTNFICFARDKYRNKKNLRMIELLEAAGLSSRFYCADRLNAPIGQLDSLSDASDLNAGLDRLIPMIKASELFLEQQLLRG